MSRSGSASSAGGAIGQVAADAGVPDGTTDNTAYLAGMLATAVAAGKTLRIPKGTNGAWVINKLTLPSNADIDATGASFVMASGVNNRLLVNTSLTLGTPGGARDSNISWNGGTFTKGTGQTNANSLEDMCLMFGFVDGLRLANIKLIQTGTGGTAGTGGRYGLYLYGVTQFQVTNWVGSASSVNQGTLQVYGGCSQGHFRNITGTFGDDVVALVPRDLAVDEITGQIGIGDIHHIQIEDIFATARSNGVKLLGGSTAGSAPFFFCRDILVRNVNGDFGSGASGSTGAAFIGGDTGYSSLTNGFVFNCTLENITNTRLTWPAVRFRNSGTVKGIVLRNCRNADNTPSIYVDSGIGPGSQIKIADTFFSTTQTTGTYYPISIATTVRDLMLENLRMESATTGTATVGFLQMASGATVGTLVVNNLKTVGKAYGIGDIGASTAIFARNVSGEDANMQGWFIATGGTINVFEWSGQNVGTAGFTAGAGTVVSLDMRFQVDLSNTSMSRPANSVAYNTNAALACGAGPVVSNGTSWKHLYTGATY